MKPIEVATIHRGICAREKCKHLEKINYLDPCSECPSGHFGRYEYVGCEEPDRAIPSSELPTLGHVLLPGELLSKVIYRITGQRPCGMCSTRVKTMNEKGWWWCWRNRATIVDWLVQEAKKRGHEIHANEVTALLKAVWKEIRK